MKRFHTWKWHSINIVPFVNMYNIGDGEVEGCPIIGHLLEVTLLGRVFTYMFSSTQFKEFRSFDFVGPLWSRKQKCWYSAHRDFTRCLSAQMKEKQDGDQK